MLVSNRLKLHIIPTCLAARGFAKGDVLAIWSPSVPNTRSPLGRRSRGGIVTTINPLYNAIELAHQLRDSGAECSCRAADRATRRPPRRSARTCATCSSFGEAAAVSRSLPSRRAVARWRRRRSIPGGRGRPALFRRHHRPAEGRDADALQLGRRPRPDAGPCRDEAEVVIGVVPFYHVDGFHVVMNLTLHAGATLVSSRASTSRNSCARCRTSRVTTALRCPPSCATLAGRPPGGAVRSVEPSLHHVGGRAVAGG